MYYLILQTVSGGAFPELSAAIHEACQQENWWEQNQEHVCLWGAKATPRKVEELISNVGIEHVIPVGSIDYINAFLSAAGEGPLRAINIPPELDDCRFLLRSVTRNASIEDLPRLYRDYGKLFVKPGRHPKRFEMFTWPDENAYISQIPKDEPLFVSEALPSPIAAEWRLFCQRGRIVSARPYILDAWVVPDRKLAEEMAARLAPYPAVTLDVAVLESGDTAALEVHNFLACGLYGFEGPRLLQMTKAAWKWQLNQN